MVVIALPWSWPGPACRWTGSGKHSHFNLPLCFSFVRHSRFGGREQIWHSPNGIASRRLLYISAPLVQLCSRTSFFPHPAKQFQLSRPEPAYTVYVKQVNLLGLGCGLVESRRTLCPVNNLPQRLPPALLRQKHLCLKPSLPRQRPL